MTLLRRNLPEWMTMLHTKEKTPLSQMVKGFRNYSRILLIKTDLRHLLCGFGRLEELPFPKIEDTGEN